MVFECAEDRTAKRVKGSAAVPSRPRIALARGVEWAAEPLAGVADVTVLTEGDGEEVFAALARRFPGGGPDLAVFAGPGGLGAVAVQAVRAGHPAVRRTTTVVVPGRGSAGGPLAARAREAVVAAGAGHAPGGAASPGAPPPPRPPPPARAAAPPPPAPRALLGAPPGGAVAP